MIFKNKNANKTKTEKQSFQQKYIKNKTDGTHVIKTEVLYSEVQRRKVFHGLE